MASIVKEIRVPASPDRVWQQVRDFGQVHKLFPGIVSECKMDGEARVVKFSNGIVVREILVDISDERRRLVYASVGGRATHHNASIRVFADGAGSRVVWTLDFLPNELAPAIKGLVDAGGTVMKSAFATTA
ncbi:SRPBCC family protein [Caenimonas koreensis]|uniref:SRPBCC family protein n=1 Tax=Caenimonas koreensis DSM 17982 TaxID=1121255 RepID=A0A844B4T4_9BURK|nr:SRPBCC family protein [Caenimonas koreensis]MRD48233.1 SRPBCC family protein [Caenimonas koreensis DSM 17982]